MPVPALLTPMHRYSTHRSSNYRLFLLLLGRIFVGPQYRRSWDPFHDGTSIKKLSSNTGKCRIFGSRYWLRDSCYRLVSPLLTHSLIQSLSHLLALSLTLLLTLSFTHSLTHLLSHSWLLTFHSYIFSQIVPSVTHLFLVTHSLIYSLISPFFFSFGYVQANHRPHGFPTTFSYVRSYSQLLKNWIWYNLTCILAH